jgi:hypothetical protein
VPIFRCAIFGSVLLAVLDIFCLFIFFGWTTIFSSAIISKYGLHVGDMWQFQVMTCGNFWE